MAWAADFNWLPNSLLKGITLPQLIYDPEYEANCGGCYQKNVIIIKECDEPANIIAHEFQHYLQDMAGMLTEPVSWQETYEAANCDYEAAITKYFQQWHEYDALRFEFKVAPTELNEYWWRALVQGYGD